MTAKPVRGTAKIKSLEQRIGGRQEWTEYMVNKNEVWVNQIHYEYDHVVRDEAAAKERAGAILREKSFKYMRAEGVGV